MEQYTDLSYTLYQRSKKAMMLGILSEAIPLAIVLLGYLILLIFLIPLLHRGLLDVDFSYLLISLEVFLVSCIAAGLVMLLLGIPAAKQGRSVGIDARKGNVRRHPMSVVAQVLGIVGIVGGIFLIVFFAIYALVLLVVFTTLL